MKLTDTLSGVIVAAFGVAVASYARTFPPMPGQPVGPGLFPTIVGLGFVAFGAMLVVAGLRAGERPVVTFEAWTRRRRTVLAGLAVPAALVFYVLVVDRLGFLLTGVVFLGGLFAIFGANRRWMVPAAVVVTLALHYGFQTLLRVPLPWGVLEGIAW